MVAVLFIVLASVTMPVAAATSPTVDGETDTLSLDSRLGLMQQGGNGTANNSTTTSGSGVPTQAEQVRINPIHFEEGYLGVSVNESDSAYKTKGPFVLFSVSQPVKSARITQQPAQATVLEGGRQVKVAYSDDAAPSGKESLYRLELFFEDGSTKTVKLFARKTGVSVAAADLKEYQPVIDELKDRAEEHGYETTPDALLNYIDWVNERADLVEGWLSEKAAQLFAGLLVLASNWLFWLVALGGVALLAQWIRKKFAGILDALENDPGKAARKRDQLEVAYEQQKQSADEESLSNVDAIGANSIYWEEAFGTKSPAQLANIAVRGLHRRDENGDIQRVHGGVDELGPQDIEQSWLEPVLRGNRIPTAKQALAELKAACERMETKYSMGHIYRPARDRLVTLIDQLDQEHQQTVGRHRRQTGGDD